MENKNPLYIGIGIFIILILVVAIVSSGILNGGVSKEVNPKQIKSGQTNSALEKYRSEDIPEDCRLPNYESSVSEWVEHLSHHKPTWYCLEYYGTSIEEMNN